MLFVKIIYLKLIVIAIKSRRIVLIKTTCLDNTQELILLFEIPAEQMKMKPTIVPCTWWYFVGVEVL